MSFCCERCRQDFLFVQESLRSHRAAELLRLKNENRLLAKLIAAANALKKPHGGWKCVKARRWQYENPTDQTVNNE